MYSSPIVVKERRKLGNHHQKDHVFTRLQISSQSKRIFEAEIVLVLWRKQNAVLDGIRKILVSIRDCPPRTQLLVLQHHVCLMNDLQDATACLQPPLTFVVLQKVVRSVQHVVHHVEVEVAKPKGVQMLHQRRDTMHSIVRAVLGLLASLELVFPLLLTLGIVSLVQLVICLRLVASNDVVREVAMSRAR
jgi:hypothetical protein